MKNSIIVMSLFALMLFPGNVRGSDALFTEIEPFVLWWGFPFDAITPETSVELERREDVLGWFGHFMKTRNVTTNQFVNALIFTATNNLTEARLADERNFRLAGLSLDALSRIDLPEARSFIRTACTNDLHGMVINCAEGPFRFGNFDAETMDYMYRWCVMTNRYDRSAGYIASSMALKLHRMSERERLVAMTNVARFVYFTLYHTSIGLNTTEPVMLELVPSFTNSWQRLRAMEHIANTTTNAHVREWTRAERDRLLALPTNQLNNVQWLEAHP